jgi:hypothetical protein
MLYNGTFSVFCQEFGRMILVNLFKRLEVFFSMVAAPVKTEGKVQSV